MEKNNIVTWAGFDAYTVETFRTLFSDKLLSDVTLACEDGVQIQAHKAILSSSSNLFENIILRNPHQHPMIYMKGVKRNILESIMEFIYLGQTKVAVEDIAEFFNTAVDLDVKGIKQDNLDVLENLASNLENINMSILEDMLSKFEDEIPLNSKRPIGHKKQCESKEDTKNEIIVETNRNKLENGKFPCDQCDYQAKQMGDVRKHILAKHEGKKFECKECKKSFCFKHDLRKHERKFHNKSK